MWREHEDPQLMTIPFAHSPVHLHTEPRVQRRIVGFHQDGEGHWVADLECGHSQHMRHEPPWQVRSWVLTAEGRAGMVGQSLACAECQGLS